MSKVMTPTIGHPGNRSAHAAGERNEAAGELLEGARTYYSGSSAAVLANSGRAQTECLVLLRAIRRRDHRLDSGADSGGSRGIDRRNGGDHHTMGGAQTR